MGRLLIILLLIFPLAFANNAFICLTNETCAIILPEEQHITSVNTVYDRMTTGIKFGSYENLGHHTSSPIIYIMDYKNESNTYIINTDKTVYNVDISYSLNGHSYNIIESSSRYVGINYNNMLKKFD